MSFSLHEENRHVSSSLTDSAAVWSQSSNELACMHLQHDRKQSVKQVLLVKVTVPCAISCTPEPPACSLAPDTRRLKALHV